MAAEGEENRPEAERTDECSRNNKLKHRLSDKFQLLVTCHDEADQRMLYERLTRQRRRCRVLVM
jgi:hypothetical protein